MSPSRSTPVRNVQPAILTVGNTGSENQFQTLSLGTQIERGWSQRLLKVAGYHRAIAESQRLPKGNGVLESVEVSTQECHLRSWYEAAFLKLYLPAEPLEH
ncbi:Hypothetical predicted protein [Pelobates cultripes]|uniref:Uncharacterized protein n=1 Tax=Pelobates cultripes TaxID=61616 RepID=A0AAD1STZ6_PELCU|nr:Hypothetical predicted protein [Pelobates cultripes]